MTSRVTGGGGKVDKMIAVDPEEGNSLIAADEDDTSSNAKKTKTKVKRLRKKKTDHSPLIKYGSLVLLVAQLVGLVMLMRYSRTHTNGKDLYLSSTAVFCMEVRFLALL